MSATLTRSSRAVVPLRLVTVSVVIALALVGCGGSDDDPGSGSSEDAAVTTGALSGEDSGTERAETGPGSDDRAEAGRRTNERADRRLTPAERQQETDRIHALVRELIDATNANDESVCTRLYDQHLIEPSKRDEATAGCKRGIARQRGELEVAKIEIVRIRQTKRGREAGVQFLVSQEKRRTTRYAYHLIYKDGEYRIDRGIPVKQPGQ
jgi:hypothetical protein